MIQVFARQKNGRFVTALEDFECDPSNPPYEMAWLDLEKPSPDEIAWLARQFRFHPLALEDCLHFDQRPKVEEYVNHLFVVVHGLLPAGTEGVEVYELHFFLAPGLVVTVHDLPIPALEQYRRRVTADRGQLCATATSQFHRLLDVTMDANPAVLDRLRDELEELDEVVFTRRESRDIERIHALQHRLMCVRNILGPQRAIYESMIGGRFPVIDPQIAPYLRDVNDHLVHLLQLIDEVRDGLGSLRDALLSLSAYRTGESMKRLTVFSVVFLPLTFITGFFGMNFEHVPFGSRLLFDACVALILIVPIVMLLWFARRDWI